MVLCKRANYQKEGDLPGDPFAEVSPREKGRTIVKEELKGRKESQTLPEEE